MHFSWLFQVTKASFWGMKISEAIDFHVNPYSLGCKRRCQNSFYLVHHTKGFIKLLSINYLIHKFDF